MFIELPGVDMSRISAKVSGGNTLVIEGTTEATSYEGTRILNERRTGKFSRYITLPEAVKGEPMAMMDRGVLQVEVAKAGKGAQAAA